MIIAVALTVEVLFLGLSVALQLRSSGTSRFVAAAITAGLSLLVAVGAILGALVLGDADDAVLSLVLAFAGGRRAVVVGRRGIARRGSRDARAALDGGLVFRRLPRAVLSGGDRMTAGHCGLAPPSRTAMPAVLPADQERDRVRCALLGADSCLREGGENRVREVTLSYR